MPGLSRHVASPVCCLTPDTSQTTPASRHHVRANTDASGAQKHAYVSTKALHHPGQLSAGTALTLLLDPQPGLPTVVPAPGVQRTSYQQGPALVDQQWQRLQHRQQQAQSCQNQSPWSQQLQRPTHLPGQLRHLVERLRNCTDLQQLHSAVSSNVHMLSPSCLAVALQQVVRLQRQRWVAALEAGEVPHQHQHGVQPQQLQPLPTGHQQLKADLVAQLSSALVRQLPAASGEDLTAFLAAAAADQLLLPEAQLERIAAELVHRALRQACEQRQQQLQDRNQQHRPSASPTISSSSWGSADRQPAVGSSTQQMLVEHTLQAPQSLAAHAQAVAYQQLQQHPVATSSWALAKLRLRQPLIWQELSSLAGEQVQHLSAHDCVVLSWALAKTKQYQPRLFNAVQHRLKGHTQQLSPDEISCLMWSFATVGHYHHAGTAALVTAAAGSMERFGPRALSRTLWACVKLRHFDPRLLSALRVKALASMQDFEPQSLSTLMWGLASFGVRDAQLTHAVAQRALAVIRGFSIQGLANLAWAVARVQQLQQPTANQHQQHSSRNKHSIGWRQSAGSQQLVQQLISYISTAAVALLPTAKPQEVCNLLWACAVLQHRDQELLTAACSRLVAVAEESSPRDLAQAAWALQTLKHHSKSTNQVLSRHALNKLHLFGPQALSNWAWAAATAGMRLPACTQAAVAQQCQVLLLQFTPQGLATTLWAISKMGRVPQQLLHEASSHILANMQCYNAQDICNISMVCAKAGYREPALLQGLANAASSAASATLMLQNGNSSSNIELPAPQQTARLQRTELNGTHQSGTGRHRSNQLQPDQPPGLVPFTVLRQKQLTPQGICNLVWAFAGMGWHDPLLLQQLQQLAAAAVLDGQLKAENIAALVQGFALLGCKCDVLFDALQQCRVLGLDPARHKRGRHTRPARFLHSASQLTDASAATDADAAFGELQQEQRTRRWRRQLLSWPADALALLLWGGVSSGAHHTHARFMAVVLEVLADTGVSGLSDARRAQLHLALTLLATHWGIVSWGPDRGLGWAEPCTCGQVVEGSDSSSNSTGSSCSVGKVMEARGEQRRQLPQGVSSSALAALCGPLARHCATAWQHEEAAAMLNSTEEQVLQTLQSMGLKPLVQRWLQPMQHCHVTANASGWSSHGLRVNVGLSDNTQDGCGVHQPVAIEIVSDRAVSSSWPVRVLGLTDLKHQCLRAAGWQVVLLTEEQWDSLGGERSAQQRMLRQLLHC